MHADRQQLAQCTAVRLGPLTQTRFDGRRSGWRVSRRQTSSGVATRSSTWRLTHRWAPVEAGLVNPGGPTPPCRSPANWWRRPGPLRDVTPRSAVARAAGVGSGSAAPRDRGELLADGGGGLLLAEQTARADVVALDEGRRARARSARAPEWPRWTVEPWLVAMWANVPRRSLGPTTEDFGDIAMAPGAAGGGGSTWFPSGTERRRGGRAAARKRAWSLCSWLVASAIVAPLRASGRDGEARGPVARGCSARGAARRGRPAGGRSRC